MNKKYKNILLESTTNEKIKELEGQVGILEVSQDGTKINFLVQKQKIIIPVISSIGDFSNPNCDDMWVRDSENYSDYTFIKTDNFKTLEESEE